MLQRLSLLSPKKDNQEDPGVSPGLGLWCFARIRRTTSLSISTPKVRETVYAIRGQPNLGFRRLISTTALMSSCAGPLGPGRLLPLF